MKKIGFCCGTIILALLFFWIGWSEQTVCDLSDHVLRLHILANSDSAEDQALKLAVRDRLLSYMRERKIAGEEGAAHLTEFAEVCRREVQSRGYSYPIRVSFGDSYFPTKRYADIALPAGNYRAVRVLIGEGAGQNWWCVMYPPLCFAAETEGELDETEKAELKALLSEEEYRLISASDAVSVKPAFKLVELWQKLKKKVKVSS